MPVAVPRFARRTLFVLGLLSCSAVVACAQESTPPQKWALLIGIDQYEDRNHIAGLGGASKDARALKAVLTEAAGVADDHIQLLVSDGPIKPTRTNILNGLSRLVKNAHPGDVVFLLYSGHGIEVDGKPYLLPYDTSALDDSTVVDTALEKAKFDQRLTQIRARALILAFDMCRSDPRATGKDIQAGDNRLGKSLTRGLDFHSSTEDTSRVSATAPITVSLFACSEGERSYEWQDEGRGYFSWYLEQGLRGKAADGQGRVTVSGLTRYIQNQVSAAVARNEGNRARQTPFPEMRGPNVGDYVLTSTAKGPASITDSEVLETHAVLRVLVDVLGATISVDGREVAGGQYRENLLDSESKSVLVKVTAAGYEGKLVRTTLTRGKTVTVPITLSRIKLRPLSEILTVFSSGLVNSLCPLRVPVPGLPLEKQGYDQANAGQYDQAIATLTQALAKYPTNSDPFFNRGWVYESLGQHDRAIIDWSAFLMKNPTLADAYNNRGVAYSGRQQFDLAIADFTKALMLKPSLLNALSNRANAYYASGNKQAALADYKKYAAARPTPDVPLQKRIAELEGQMPSGR